jgi:hypothetical protein
MEIENAAPDEGATTTDTTTTTEPAGGGEDAAASRLLAQFEDFTSNVNSRFDQMEQRIQPETDNEEEEEESDDFDFELSPSDFDDDDFTDEGTLTPEAQRRAFMEAVRAAVRAELAPRERAEAEQRRSAEADALEQKYPRLQDPKVQQEMIDKTIEWAQSVGKPELAQEPKLLEMVYLAAEAGRRAEGEIPAGSTREVRLETGTGAPPAEQSKEDEGDRIVGLARKRHHRIGA